MTIGVSNNLYCLLIANACLTWYRKVWACRERSGRRKLQQRG